MDQAPVTRAKRSLTKMIIIVNISFTVSNCAPSLSYILYNFFNLSLKNALIISTISNLLLFVTHSTSFFIYLNFDKLFRKAFFSAFFRFQC